MEEDSIIIKLAKMRNELWRNRKKSGYYDFSAGFDLAKFLPVISRLEVKYDVASVFEIGKDVGELLLYGSDSEEITFTVPGTNGNGSVDGIRRQLYMLAFGIPDTGEQHPILDWHMREIRAILDAKGVSEQGMLDYYGISTLEGMSMDQWNDAVQRLKKQKDKPKDV